jgi:hypothetical protein
LVDAVIPLKWLDRKNREKVDMNFGENAKFFLKSLPDAKYPPGNVFLPPLCFLPNAGTGRFLCEPEA